MFKKNRLAVFVKTADTLDIFYWSKSNKPPRVEAGFLYISLKRQFKI